MISGKRKQSDQWGTPPEIMQTAVDVASGLLVEKVENYDLDPCPGPHCVAKRGLTGNGLEQPWLTEETRLVFVNPPFSDIEAWINKGFQECNATFLEKYFICFIVPANRTESFWWQSFIEPYRDWRDYDLPFHITTLFLPKRTKFMPLEGQKVSSPSYACVLVCMWYNGPNGA